MEQVAGGARSGDIILTVGAGDVTGLGAELVRSLASVPDDAAGDAGDAGDAGAAGAAGAAGKAADGR